MTTITFSVPADSYVNSLRSEMGQQVTYCDKTLPFFKFVLISKVGQVGHYQDWTLEGDVYIARASFFNAMILDPIKTLTLDSEIFRSCDVDIFMTTRKKYGYYQLKNGITHAGFSVKAYEYFYDKLLSDLSEVKAKNVAFKINLTEVVNSSNEYALCMPENGERKVYSLFSNSPEVAYSRMLSAANTLKVSKSFC